MNKGALSFGGFVHRHEVFLELLKVLLQVTTLESRVRCWHVNPEVHYAVVLLSSEGLLQIALHASNNFILMAEVTGIPLLVPLLASLSVEATSVLKKLVKEFD